MEGTEICQQPRITAVMSSNRESTVRENILTVGYMQTSIMLFKVLKLFSNDSFPPAGKVMIRCNLLTFSPQADVF